jgi:hypothetical protein
MRHRNRIPSDHWGRLVRSAKARGIDGVSYELLASLAERCVA